MEKNVKVSLWLDLDGQCSMFKLFPQSKLTQCSSFKFINLLSSELLSTQTDLSVEHQDINLSNNKQN